MLKRTFIYKNAVKKLSIKITLCKKFKNNCFKSNIHWNNLKIPHKINYNKDSNNLCNAQKYRFKTF